MAEFFAEGGFWMYPISLLGIVAVALGAVALGAKQKNLAVAALACAAVVMLMGVGGMMWGRSQVDRALVMVNPEDAEKIREQGYLEANRPLQLGGPLAVLSTLLALSGFVMTRRS